MKVRDFAAELISEIADEIGFVVYKYECSSPSCGSITFEIEIQGEEETRNKKYKILNYKEFKVELQEPQELDDIDYTSTTTAPNNYRTIDLHRPESVDELKEWFEDLETAYDYPSLWPNFSFPSISISQPSYKYTNPLPSYQPIWVAPNAFPTSGGSLTIGPNTTFPNISISNTIASGTTINSYNHDNIFNFNPNFGSLTIDKI